jgi:hypothetical protein
VTETAQQAVLHFLNQKKSEASALRQTQGVDSICLIIRELSIISAKKIVNSN